MTVHGKERYVPLKQLASAGHPDRSPNRSQLSWVIPGKLALGGLPRSPWVCIAYLCQHDRQTLWDAREWVKSVHPSARPTPEQLQAIEQFFA